MAFRDCDGLTTDVRHDERMRTDMLIPEVHKFVGTSHATMFVCIRAVLVGDRSPTSITSGGERDNYGGIVFEIH